MSEHFTSGKRDSERQQFKKVVLDELDEFMQIIEREFRISWNKILQEVEKISEFSNFSQHKQEYLAERDLLSRQFDRLLQN